MCSYSLLNTEISYSNAEAKGGAIFYDLYRPELENNTFVNNTARYGNDIASYPIKIKLKDIDSDSIMLNDVVSGQMYSPTLVFLLVDHDEQQIFTDSFSTIKINSLSNNTSLDGTLVVAVNQGEATFDELILIAKPGSTNVEFQISSAAVDEDIINLQYNGTINQKNIDASFRYCESGEIETNDVCQV